MLRRHYPDLSLPLLIAKTEFRYRSKFGGRAVSHLHPAEYLTALADEHGSPAPGGSGLGVA